jgi:hypothetical protein
VSANHELVSPQSARSPPSTELRQAYSEIDNLTIDVGNLQRPERSSTLFVAPPRFLVRDTEARPFEQINEWLAHDVNHHMPRMPISIGKHTTSVSSWCHEPPLTPPQRDFSVYTEDLMRVSKDLDGKDVLLRPVFEQDDEEDYFLAERGGEQMRVVPFNQVDQWTEAFRAKQQWIAPFPGPVMNVSVVDEAQFTFSLSTTVERFATQLVQGYDITHPWSSITTRLQTNYATARIVPITIHVLSESGQLPVDCDVQLCTKMDSANRSGAMTFTSWFPPSVPNPSSNPEPTKTLCSHIVWENEPRHTSPVVAKFWCSDAVLTPEFVRWACTNLDEVEKQLEGPSCVSVGKEKIRLIRNVPRDTPRLDNHLQFLCLTEWHRVKAAEEDRKESGNLAASTFETKDTKTPSMNTFKVSTVLMKEVIEEKRKIVDAPANIMTLYKPVPTSSNSNLVLRIKSIHDNATTTATLKASGNKDALIKYRITVSIRFIKL